MTGQLAVGTCQKELLSVLAGCHCKKRFFVLTCVKPAKESFKVKFEIFSYKPLTTGKSRRNYTT